MRVLLVEDAPGLGEAQRGQIDRVVDVMEALVKFTLLVRGREGYPVDRYSERKESAQALSARVNQRSIETARRTGRACSAVIFA
jgi:hypothetical protein